MNLHALQQNEILIEIFYVKTIIARAGFCLGRSLQHLLSTETISSDSHLTINKIT